MYCKASLTMFPHQDLPFWGKATQGEKPSKLPTTEPDGNKEQASASPSKKRVSGK